MPRRLPPETRRVRCANCQYLVIDEGRRSTCPKCGMFPLPSYAYPLTSSFHPVNCNCTDEPPVTVTPQRRTPMPRKLEI